MVHEILRIEVVAEDFDWGNFAATTLADCGRGV